MSALALVAHEFRYDQKQFWRDPASVFFTVMLPLIFLFIFATIFGNDEIESLQVQTTTYYVPAIISLAVISATTQSLAINLVESREGGVLKRVRGTPLPGWVFIAGRVGNSLVVSALMVVLVAVIGRIVYGVTIPTETLPAVLVTLAAGAFTFCCIGFALTALIPSEEAAPARHARQRLIRLRRFRMRRRRRRPRGWNRCRTGSGSTRNKRTLNGGSGGGGDFLTNSPMPCSCMRPG